MRACPGSTPFPARLRVALTAAAAATSVFFGSHPRNAHVPPKGRWSIIATVQPAARHRVATAFAAAPEPTTMRSNVRVTGGLRLLNCLSCCCLPGPWFLVLRLLSLVRPLSLVRSLSLIPPLSLVPGPSRLARVDLMVALRQE